MKKYSKRLLLVNAFGTFGYFACVFLWGWTGVIYLPMLLANDHITTFLLPLPQEEVTSTPVAPEMSPAVIIFALAVTAVVMIATVVILLRAPVAIAKTGKSITTKAADSTLPMITKGKKLPKSKKRRLTAQLIKLAKLLLVLLPVTVGLLGVFITLPLPFELAVFVSSTLALFAVLWFSLQYIFARLFTIPLERLV